MKIVPTDLFGAPALASLATASEEEKASVEAAFAAGQSSPLFNGGRHGACADVYEATVRAKTMRRAPDHQMVVPAQ